MAQKFYNLTFASILFLMCLAIIVVLNLQENVFCKNKFNEKLESKYLNSSIGGLAAVLLVLIIALWRSPESANTNAAFTDLFRNVLVISIGIAFFIFGMFLWISPSTSCDSAGIRQTPKIDTRAAALFFIVFGGGVAIGAYVLNYRVRGGR